MLLAEDGDFTSLKTGQSMLADWARQETRAELHGAQGAQFSTKMTIGVR